MWLDLAATLEVVSYGDIVNAVKSPQALDELRQLLRDASVEIERLTTLVENLQSEIGLMRSIAQ
jgi:hypothetical protein